MIEERYLQEQAKLFGERVKHLRIEAGYNTQLSFAQAFIGLEKKTSILSRVERGANIQFKTIVRLANLLNNSLLNIFDFKGSFPITPAIRYSSLNEGVEAELHLLGRRISHIRKSKNLIQLDLDVTSLIDRSNISNYERGRENIKFFTIASIALTLGVEIWELFDYKGQYSDIV